VLLYGSGGFILLEFRSLQKLVCGDRRRGWDSASHAAVLLNKVEWGIETIASFKLYHPDMEDVSIVSIISREKKCC